MPTARKIRDRTAKLVFDDERQQWIIRYWTPEGERKKRRLKCGPGDRDEASRQFGEFLLEADRERKERELVDPSPDDPTVTRSKLVSVERVLAFYGERKAGTPNAEITGYHMKALLPFWAGKMLSEVNEKTCKAYAARRMGDVFVAKGAKSGRAVSKATARRELETLGAAIGAWHRKYTLDSRPLLTLPEKSMPHPDWLTDAEYQRALRVARGGRIVGGTHAKGFEWDDGGDRVPHMERFLEIAFATGTRSKMTLNLGWDPDPEGMRGHVDFGTTTVFRLGPNAPRTKKRGDPCRIPDRLVPILREWHEADMIEKAKVEKAGGEWVDRIIRYRGGSLERVGQSFDRIAKDARLEIRDIDKRDRVKDKTLGWPTPHILRHSRATLLLRAGVPPHEVAEFLSMGLTMLLETYGHHHTEYQKKAAAAA